MNPGRGSAVLRRFAGAILTWLEGAAGESEGCAATDSGPWRRITRVPAPDSTACRSSRAPSPCGPRCVRDARSTGVGKLDHRA